MWQGDNNFFRSTITHSLSGGNIYVEQSKDNPSAHPEGTRVQAGGNATISPTKQPVTIRMRYVAQRRLEHRRRAVPRHGAGQPGQPRLGRPSAERATS